MSDCPQQMIKNLSPFFPHPSLDFIPVAEATKIKSASIEKKMNLKFFLSFILNSHLPPLNTTHNS